MTAIEVDDSIVIIDMGYNMETVVQHDEEIEEMTTTSTIDIGAIPDDSMIHDKKDKVEAIVVGHGHLDHVGAVPKLAGSYDAPVIATPMTMSIAERMIEEDRKNLNNDLVKMEAGETYEITDDITLEFVDITHSIPGAVMTVLHTPDGTVVYSLDFRLDDEPVVGEPPDYDRLKELGDEGVELLIGDSTHVEDEEKGVSETSIKTQIDHIIDESYEEGGAVVATTFSSHVERLTSFLEANDGRRKVAFIGRSLKEYNRSAEELDLIDLDDVKVVSWYDEVQDLLSQVAEERDEWLIICTGNQGEPRAALTRIAKGDYPFQLREGDHVIFSSRVIPTPLNEANRYQAEKHIKEAGARMYKNIHTSGHAKREDLRDLIRMLDPENILPAHGTTEKLASFVTLARDEDYTLNKDVFICENGNTLDVEQSHAE